MTTVSEPRPAVEAVHALLEQSLRVTLTDGRVLVGLLQCVDKQGNLVLHSTREYRPASGSERAVGLVLVLRQDWVSGEAHTALAQALLHPPVR